MPTIEPIDADPAEHGLEHGQAQLVVGRHTDQHEAAAAAQRANAARNGSAAAAVVMTTSAPPNSPDRRGRVDGAGVDHGVGTQRLGQQQLVLVDVDGDDRRAGDLGVLHGEVTEAADTEHGDDVRRAGARHLDRLIGGHTGARQRRRLDRIDASGHVDDEVGLGDDVFAVAAVDAVAGVRLGRHSVSQPATQCSQRPQAVCTTAPRPASRPARRPPRRRRRDQPDPLVARHERRRRLDRPVPVRRVDVGVAQPGRLEADEDLAGSRRGTGRSSITKG